MDMVKLNAYAKLNLSLDVCGKLDNGYHEVDMIMTSCSLSDEIIIEKSDLVTLESDFENLSCGEDNLMVKAAKAFFEYTKINGGAKMRLKKNIPMSSGMAGGSTDAAAVLKGLNELYKANLSADELCEIGLKLGADVPYCIVGKTMRARGIGEDLDYIGDMEDVYVVIVKTNQGLSTRDIYRKIDNEKNLDRPDNEFLIKLIKEKNIKLLAANMKNVMEQVSVKEIPEIADIKEMLLECGAMGAMMSGSGPSVFGLFENKEKAELAAKKMNKKYFVYCGKLL